MPTLATKIFRFRILVLSAIALLIASLVPAIALIGNSPFVITSPKHNSLVSNKGVSISWNSMQGAVSYRLQLSSTDDPKFEEPDFSIKTQSLKVTRDLWPMTYIARVTAFDANNKRIGRTPTISFTASKNLVGTTTTTSPTSSTTKPTTSTTKPSVTTTAAPVTTTPPNQNGSLWVPKPGTTWYWQLGGRVDETVPVTMFDIDLFDAVPTARTYSVPGFGTVNVEKGVNAGVIDRLHAKGKIVICYVDTGAAENNRPDIHLIPESVRGTVAEASDGTKWDEKWIDTRESAWSKFAPVMWARFDLAKSIGCDGVEPDQNNHVGNNTGFPESVAYDRAWYLEVAKQAHARGLSVGMKNGVESINAELVRAFDWHLNEECNQYDECETLSPFIAAGKAVFNAEYPKVRGGASEAKTCPNASKYGLSSMGYPLDLDGGYYFDCLTGTSRL